CARRPRSSTSSTRSATWRSATSPARSPSSTRSAGPRWRSWRVGADARVFRLQLALGGAGILAAVVALGAGARAVHVAPGTAHRFQVAGLRFTYPAANAAAVLLFGLAALGAAVLLVALRAGVKQARAHRRLIRELPLAGPLPGHRATVIDVGAPLAFCA